MSKIPIFNNKFLKLAFGLGLFVILCIGGFSYMHNRELAKSTDMVKHTYDVNLELKELLSNLKNAETSERGFLLAKDSLFLSTYIYRKDKVNASIKNLQLLTANNDEQLSNLSDLELLVNERLNYLSESVHGGVMDSINTIRYRSTFAESRIKMDSIRSSVNEMIDISNGLLTTRSDDNERSLKRNPIILFSTLILTLLLLLIAYAIINRDLKFLKQQNEQLELFKESVNQSEILSMQGSWNFKLSNNKYTPSENLYRLYGEEPFAFEPTNANFMSFVHPDDRERLDKEFEKMRINFSLPYITYKVIRKDEAIRHFKTYAQLFESEEDGKIMIGTVLDITDEINDLENLKRRNNELELFKESANLSEIVSKHGSWTYNFKNDTTEYSENLFRILGEQPFAFNPETDQFMNYVHKDDREKLGEQIEKMKADEELPFIYYRIVTKNGDIRHLKAFGELFTNDYGEKKMIGTLSDITDEVENLNTLEERNHELERNNKELQAFNYVASHDLQEPLRKIQTFISRLEDKEYDNLSESSQLYLDRIKKASSRMRLLIDDLLQFSRTNKTDKSKEVTNMNVLLEGAKQELMEAIVENKSVITHVEFPKMKVIPFQIKQLFINLIGNSLKYSKENVPPIINITYERVHSATEEFLEKAKPGMYHKIIIADNGIGFEPEYSAKIFTLFHRLHGKGEYSGTGIGLAICKKIVENHQGYICADGALGEGATFCIYLPIA